MRNRRHPNSKKNFLRKFSFFVLIAILLLNTYLIWSMQSTVNRVDKYNQGVVDEIGNITGDFKLFANDLNEIRSFLLLPEVNYSILGEQQNKQPTETTTANKDTVAIFAMLNQFSKEKKHTARNQAAQESLQKLLANTEFLNNLTESSLQLGERNNLQLQFLDTSNSEFNGETIFTLDFDIEADQFTIQSSLSEHKVKNYKTDQFSTTVLNYLKSNTQKAINKKLQEQKNEAQKLKQLETESKKEVENRKKEFNSLMKDPAFLDTIKNEGWKLAKAPKEESNKLYYDVIDTESSKVVFSIGIELSSGMIKVIKDSQEINVQNFLENSNPKKKL